MAGTDYLLLVHRERGEQHEGLVVGKIKKEQYDQVTGIIAGVIENDENYRNMILEGAKKYLKRYEVDGRNFALEIYPTKNL